MSIESDRLQGESARKIWAGKTIKLVPNDAAFALIKQTESVGQFDLGFQLNGLERGYPLIHIWKPKKHDK